MQSFANNVLFVAASSLPRQGHCKWKQSFSLTSTNSFTTIFPFVCIAQIRYDAQVRTRNGAIFSLTSLHFYSENSHRINNSSSLSCLIKIIVMSVYSTVPVKVSHLLNCAADNVKSIFDATRYSSHTFVAAENAIFVVVAGATSSIDETSGSTHSAWRWWRLIQLFQWPDSVNCKYIG